MFVDRFILATRDDELNYLLPRSTVYDVTKHYDEHMPFGIFTKKRIDKLSFGKITLICGSSNSEKYLLFKIIAAKLGIKEAQMNMHCFDDYLNLCSVKYTNFCNRDFPCFMIRREQCIKYLDSIGASFDKYQKHGLLCLHESIIKDKAVYKREEPATGMSFSEQGMLAKLIEDCVNYNGSQFIVLTNSPVLMNLNKAVIYDVDISPFVPKKRYNSECVKGYLSLFENIKNGE